MAARVNDNRVRGLSLYREHHAELALIRQAGREHHVHLIEAGIGILRTRVKHLDGRSSDGAGDGRERTTVLDSGSEELEDCCRAICRIHGDRRR